MDDSNFGKSFISVMLTSAVVEPRGKFLYARLMCLTVCVLVTLITVSYSRVIPRD